MASAGHSQICSAPGALGRLPLNAYFPGIGVASTGLETLGLTEGPTYIRLRITTDTLADNLVTEDGRSLNFVNDGEVEDYLIDIVIPPDYGDAPASYGDAFH